ncbi:MAG: hypothetical protein H8E34_06065 [Bacteroidetes bacterium]|nr:hypothetical protein [Bacteroidota bacterium]
MRNFTIIGIIIIFSILILSGCNKDETKIRAKNIDGFSRIENVTVGPVSFGTLSVGETTSYKAITEGTHNVSWKWPTGTGMDDKVTISGTGKYTLNVTTLGVSLVKD